MKKTFIVISLLIIILSSGYAIDLENSIAKAKQNNKELLMAMEEIRKADENRFAELLIRN